MSAPAPWLPGLRALWSFQAPRAAASMPPDQAERPAVIRSSGEKLSYANLAAAIDCCANHLRDAGAREGKVVGVALADPAGLLVAALAAWECGAAVLPLDVRGAPPASTGVPASVEALAGRVQGLLLVTSLELEGAVQLRTLPGAAALDPRCGLVLFTSGSSGAPKGVLLPRAGLAANVDAILGYLPLRASHMMPIILPLTYSYALVGQALAGLRAGATLLLLGDLRYPALQLEAMARFGAQGLSAVPTQLKLLARAQIESERDGVSRDAAAQTREPLSLEYVASAGAHLDAATAALLRRAFPGARLFNQYGLTEASPRVAALGDDHPAFARGAAGAPLAGIEVWAENEQGERLAAGESGAICVRGPSIMLGYLDDEAATARVLSGGVLRTGDVGRVDADGVLFIEGRGDGVVKIGGERVGLEGIAESLRAAPGVACAAVVALPDQLLGARLFAFVELEGGFSELGAQMVAGVVRAMPVARRPGLSFGLLPRTASGKIDLAMLRKLAALGEEVDRDERKKRILGESA